jgi:hypothetical protein
MRERRSRGRERDEVSHERAAAPALWMRRPTDPRGQSSFAQPRGEKTGQAKKDSPDPALVLDTGHRFIEGRPKALRGEGGPDNVAPSPRARAGSPSARATEAVLIDTNEPWHLVTPFLGADEMVAGGGRTRPTCSSSSTAGRPRAGTWPAGCSTSGASTPTRSHSSASFRAPSESAQGVVLSSRRLLSVHESPRRPRPAP